jgi:hypothetical protein
MTPAAQPILPPDDSDVPLAGLGDNSGDVFAGLYDDVDNRVAAFLRGADVWHDRKEFDKDLAERANDFITGARLLYAEAEKHREAEKAPVLKKGREIDAKWKALQDKIQKIVATVKPKVEAYLAAERKRQAEEQKKRDEEARLARAAAEAAEAAAALANKPSEQIEAEATAEEARKAAAAAERNARNVAPAKVASATGIGRTASLRRVRVVKLTHPALAFTYFKNAPELHDLLETLAKRHCAAMGIDAEVAIPGFDISIEEKL